MTRPSADLDTVRAIKEKFCYVGDDLKLEETLATETTRFSLKNPGIVSIGGGLRAGSALNSRIFWTFWKRSISAGKSANESGSARCRNWHTITVIIARSGLPQAQAYVTFGSLSHLIFASTRIRFGNGIFPRSLRLPPAALPPAWGLCPKN
ncbi:hypothetical protein PAPYR_11631 [Paratrimastix pyriformis]|uniref:Uncharacterized protein n=1 Tax=Paratrimastix pyriformis TaxID=342808 RepID=A0ABQ8UAF3_9EUKA|nr:hypothetical protein PAPYR_11631 [Paratrimastix pyriformis]